VCSGAANVAARERAATQSDVADDVSSDVVRWRSWYGAGRQRRRRVALSPSARAAARGGAATARRADEWRRGMMSPMTSVAARGVDVGAVQAGSVGDVLPSRRVRARRRERATVSDRRCGLAAASCDAGRPHG